jgi:hypothetical protein
VPQLFVSVDRLTSQPFAATPSQLPQPGVHDATAHDPETQEAIASESEHALPHALQLLALVDRLTSQPFAATPSQLPQPGVHDATAHDPPMHQAVASESEQAVPHAPQLAGSVCVLTHPPAQLVKGDMQLAPHTPPEQTCPPTQTCPQPPQLDLSV